MRDQQKREEEVFVARLFEALETEPGNLAPCDPAPDFVATVDGMTIGIEVTQLFRAPSGGRPRQAVEAERTRIVGDAQKRWVESGGPPVNVLVHFNNDLPLQRGSRDHLVTALVELVRRNRVEDGSVFLEYTWLNRDWFPREFAFVRIFDYPPLIEVAWTSSDSDHVESLSVELLEERIAAKRGADYQSGFDESWLLVAMDTRRISSSFDVQANVVQHRYVSRFDKIFLLDFLARRAWQLGQPGDVQ